MPSQFSANGCAGYVLGRIARPTDDGRLVSRRGARQSRSRRITASYSHGAASRFIFVVGVANFHQKRRTLLGEPDHPKRSFVPIVDKTREFGDKESIICKAYLRGATAGQRMLRRVARRLGPPHDLDGLESTRAFLEEKSPGSLSNQREQRVNHVCVDADPRHESLVRRTLAVRKFNFTGYRLGILFVGLLAAAMTPAARGQEGATPPHWIWHPTGRDLEDDVSRRDPLLPQIVRGQGAVAAGRSKPRRTTASRSTSMERKSLPATTGTTPKTSRRSCRSASTCWRPLPTNDARARPACWCAAASFRSDRMCRSTATRAGSRRRPCRRANDGPGSDFDDSNWVRAPTWARWASGPWGPITSGADPAARFHVPAGFQGRHGRRAV